MPTDCSEQVTLLLLLRLALGVRGLLVLPGSCNRNLVVIFPDLFYDLHTCLCQSTGLSRQPTDLYVLTVVLISFDQICEHAPVLSDRLYSYIKFPTSLTALT